MDVLLDLVLILFPVSSDLHLSSAMLAPTSLLISAALCAATVCSSASTLSSVLRFEQQKDICY